MGITDKSYIEKVQRKYRNIDPRNVPGKVLADIGREVISKTLPVPPRSEVEMTDIRWLNMRVEEVCQKGRL